MTLPNTRFVLPAVLLAGAAILLLASIFQPYWRLTMEAPQYPQGLTVHAHLNRLEGDVREIDGLNHYIGMRPLGEAAEFEKSVSIIAVTAIALLVFAAVFVHNVRALWLSLPALAFPLLFLADLAWWLRTFGTNLDPTAPLSSAIEPFVPPVLGRGEVGQFATIAAPATGLWMAILASAVILVGLYLQRRAYKPLADGNLRDLNTARGRDRRSARLALIGVLLLFTGHFRVLDGAQIVRPADGPDGLAHAIASAEPGDTIRVLSGHYTGPLSVDRPLTLIGEEWPVVDGVGRGTVVRITAPNVELSGFFVRGSGASLDEENSGIAVEAPRARIVGNRLEDVLFGVYTRQAADTEIRDNRITGKDLPIARRGDAIRIWYSDGVSITNNDVERSRDVVLWYSRNLELRDNVVRNGRYGLHFMYCDDASIRGNLLLGNSVGAFLMYSRRLDFTGNTVAGNRGPSGYGVGLKDMDDAVIRGNLFAGNRTAAFLDNSPREINSRTLVTGNRMVGNDNGVEMMPNVRRVRFEGNGFESNVEQVAISGQGGAPEANHWLGNYWSDYRGYDADRDGRGDLAYRADRLFESLADRSPELRLFRYGPSTAAVDLAARLMPLFRPVPKLEDPVPSMAPPVLASVPPLPTSDSASLVALAAVLISGAALVWFLAVSPPTPERSLKAAAPSNRTGHSTPGIAALGSTSPDNQGVRPMIEVRGLTKDFADARALDDVSFSIASGESVALWGPNGAGKTTLLRALLGLIPIQGEVSVAGCNPFKHGEETRRQVGFVPQEVALDGSLDVDETLRFYSRLRRVEWPRATEIAAEMSLTEHLGKRVQALSGGQRQRLALAVALLADPPVLLLDEPTANLDARARYELVYLLAGLAGSRTVVFTSHRSDEVRTLADRLLWLDAGNLVHDGQPQGLSTSVDAQISVYEFGLPPCRVSSGEAAGVPAGRRSADTEVGGFRPESRAGLEVRHGTS